MIIGDWYQHLRKELPIGEALLLLSFVLHRDKAGILAHPEYSLSDRERTLLEHYAERRKNGEPLSYITGEKEFFGLTFLVTRDTLIPRPETETLVEYVLGRIQNLESEIWDEEKTISILDIGTGSGCIPISILSALRQKNPDIFSRIRCLATDLSPAALTIAKRNAFRHDIRRDISFQESHLLSHIPESYFDTESMIITANLPYLSEAIYDASPKEVRCHEPQSALKGGGDDGTALIRTLLDQYRIKRGVRQDACLILEISPEQGISLMEYGRKLFPLSPISLLPDLAGKDRFLIIENNPSDFS